jgi:hypothetical protein
MASQNDASILISEHYAQGVKIRSDVYAQSRELLWTGKFWYPSKTDRAQGAEFLRQLHRSDERRAHRLGQSIKDHHALATAAGGQGFGIPIED